MKRLDLLLAIYDTLLTSLGPSHWWPGDSPLEIAVGAVLTQNTNWGNVDKAIANLKAANALDGHTLLELPDESLAELIRPAGYFRLKAKRLKNLLAFMNAETGLDLSLLAEQDAETLRGKLLQVKGVGPETADSILLYALGKPSFVVDAYTARITSRHGLLPEETPYEELRAYFMDVLEPDPALYNEYHALLVRVGNAWCKKKAPLCHECPLESYLD
jgi:endonuclease-3 related protein